MMESETMVCPICDEGNVGKIRQLESRTSMRYECERCGAFEIDRILLNLNPKPWDEVKHLVSAWVRRENKIGIVIPIVAQGANFSEVSSPKWWIDQFSRLGFPESTHEKLDALLLAFADMIKSDYKKQISYGLPHLVAEIAAKNVNEVNGLIDFLKECGYVDEHPRITAKGWRHIDDLRKTTIVSNSAFIAMWFGDATKKYRDSAVAAIKYCGYKPIVVDQQEYNDFIMNQVISFIRQTRFLVADFTCRPEIIGEGKVINGVRGGVYWEAGMAYGLGRPVIHTCEDSVEARSRIHFDVNQYNTIFWDEDDLGTEIRALDQPRTNPNFAEKLAVRILATVGKGIHQN